MLRHLPNFLSALRLALAPVIAWLIVTEYYLAAFGAFAFAGFTDAIDGSLAKLLKCPTQFGKVLDPIADKALMLSAFLALTWIGNVPVWLAIVVIGRDVLIAVAVGIAVLRGVRLDTTPLFIGKVTTALQVTYVAVHLAALAFSLSLGAAVPADAYILAAVTALSGGAYFWRWFEQMRTPAAV